jgi:hypothetical protein
MSLNTVLRRIRSWSETANNKFIWNLNYSACHITWYGAFTDAEFVGLLPTIHRNALSVVIFCSSIYFSEHFLLHKLFHWADHNTSYALSASMRRLHCNV